MSARADIVDPDDFCRRCRGQGGGYDETERGTTIFEPCSYCRGTGRRTVRIDLVRARRSLTMQEALRFVEVCEMAPGLIATDGMKGQVQFEAPANLTIADLQTYLEAFAAGVEVAPASLKITHTKTLANEPCGLVTIYTEN